MVCCPTNVCVFADVLWWNNKSFFFPMTLGESGTSEIVWKELVIQEKMISQKIKIGVATCIW